MQVVPINSSVIGSVLIEDVYQGKTLLVRKGNVLTAKVVNELKKRGIESIKILNNMESETELPQQTFTLHEADLLERRKLLKRDFYQALTVVGSEKRYGKLLSDANDFAFVEELFIHVALNENVYSLLQTLKSWDKYSFYHSFDVFILGALLLKKYKVQQIETLAAGLLLHDIGKIEIPQEILLKPSKLNNSEFEKIKNHTILGYRILEKYKFPKKIMNMAKDHHERIDGTGYPGGVDQNLISLEVRILMIVDVYSAVTLERPYRLPFSAAKAIQLLLNDANQFDSDCLTQFIHLLAIYPEKAIVKLSNNKIAQIVNVKDFHPTIPLVQILGNKEITQLPTNYSVTVSNLLSWNRQDPSANEQAIHQLRQGEKKKVISFFEKAVDGKNIEYFYKKASELLQEIELLWKNNKIPLVEKHLATTTLWEVLDRFLEFYHRETDLYSGLVMTTTIGAEPYSLSLKIIADSLKLNKWKVFNIGYGVPKEEKLAFIQSNEVDKLVISIQDKNNVALLLETCRWLKKKLPNLIIVTTGIEIVEKKGTGIDFHSNNFEAILDYMNPVVTQMEEAL
ncbi:hypothetical protein GCM10008967_03660 [Bacillus carboniphilus]|uniref:HD-GYP domain-containing protein n=1 Tax=Bacillus carboniphilus TaxID=86663 RepID=A0ABN0VSP7_9BACI